MESVTKTIKCEPYRAAHVCQMLHRRDAYSGCWAGSVRARVSTQDMAMGSEMAELEHNELWGSQCLDQTYLYAKSILQYGC